MRPVLGFALHRWPSPHLQEKGEREQSAVRLGCVRCCRIGAAPMEQLFSRERGEIEAKTRAPITMSTRIAPSSAADELHLQNIMSVWRMRLHAHAPALALLHTRASTASAASAAGDCAKYMHELPWSQVIAHSASGPATELSSIAIARHRSLHAKASLGLGMPLRRERAKDHTIILAHDGRAERFQACGLLS